MSLYFYWFIYVIASLQSNPIQYNLFDPINAFQYAKYSICEKKIYVSTLETQIKLSSQYAIRHHKSLKEPLFGTFSLTARYHSNMDPAWGKEIVENWEEFSKVAVSPPLFSKAIGIIRLIFKRYHILEM